MTVHASHGVVEIQCVIYNAEEERGRNGQVAWCCSSWLFHAVEVFCVM